MTTSSAFILRSCLALCLVLASPAFGDETYACFKKGASDPEPRRFVISTDGVEWLGTVKRLWQIHTKRDYCNASYTYFSAETGSIKVSCFNRKEAKVYDSETSLGSSRDDDSSLTINTTWRCVAVD